MTFSDSGGATVWSPRRPPPGLYIQPPPRPIAPGESTAMATIEWDQHRCDQTCAIGQGAEGNQVPSGAYTAHGSFYPPDGTAVSSGQAALAIRAGP